MLMSTFPYLLGGLIFIVSLKTHPLRLCRRQLGPRNPPRKHTSSSFLFQTVLGCQVYLTSLVILGSHTSTFHLRPSVSLSTSKISILRHLHYFSNCSLPSLHFLTHLNYAACLPSFHRSTASPISLLLSRSRWPRALYLLAENSALTPRRV